MTRDIVKDPSRSPPCDIEIRRRPISEHQDSVRDITLGTLAQNKDPLVADGHASGDGHHNNKDRVGGVREEWRSIALLLFLYLLQGIPLGLGSAVPLLLQNRRISYKEQALFSLVTWPFSVKLLWAPIVDSLYSSRFGRRKSWLVPTQYAIGLSFFWLSSHVRFLLGDEEGGSTTKPSVLMLTLIFMSLNFLAATQDIAVDGWALTMLSRRHVGYASTCNSVGQTAGYILGNVVLLALESADFCNRYLRSVPHKDGIVTLDGFLYFWGILFMVTTTLVALLKHEQDASTTDEDGHPDLGITQTYKMALRIFQLPSVRTQCIFLLTCKVGFAAADNVTGLKLLQAGLRRENLALLAIPMVPVQIMLPFMISKHTGGHRPLNVFFKAYPYRLFLGLMFMVLLHWTYHVKNTDGTFPIYYYTVIVVVYAVHQVTVYSCSVSMVAFHARVSDPAIGGTYMTLLNTIANLGSNWPATLSLWMVDSLTFTQCVGATKGWLRCSSKEDHDACSSQRGTCETMLDGYNIEMVLCIMLGFLWLLYARQKAHWLQSLPQSAWKCN
ncbi:acetyl-coenzyme A transporter 1-like isoform X1 [Dermacentor variabilis]|uniref:acetyl-coenzyme A transporter 1-like isoform X1 n=1 Tax=Dermacentor variabilis TaxID=34621 RepID=UPI003F5BF2A1